MSNDETFEKFKECAVEVLQVPEDKITKDARFAEDLDADSLDLVELVMALEETFDVYGRRDRARGHRDHRPGLRPDRRQALMLLGIGPDGPITGRRVAITGLGVVSCCGIGTDAFWAGLHGPAPEGERRVHDFDPERWFTPRRPAHLDRFAQFSVAVADMALADAGDLDADPGRSGRDHGHRGRAASQTLETQILVYAEKGARRVSPRLVPMMMSNAGAAAVSMRLGWHGPSETVITACAAGAHRIAHAARLVASGRCDVAIGGAAEAGMTDVGIAAFANMTALSTSGHSRPFDVRRDGFVMTEGAGALVLEDWDRAVARGARIYGELAGAASTADAHHITAPAPGGSGAAACMQLAMDDAGIDPGRGRPHQRPRHLDPAQRPGRVGRHRQGVRAPTRPPVTSTKGVTGHGLGASGAIEAVAARAHHRPRAASRRPPATRSPTPRSTSTSWPARPGRGSPARSCPTRSASAATTAAWSSPLPESAAGSDRSARAVGVTSDGRPAPAPTVVVP